LLVLSRWRKREKGETAGERGSREQRGEKKEKGRRGRKRKGGKKGKAPTIFKLFLSPDPSKKEGKGNRSGKGKKKRGKFVLPLKSGRKRGRRCSGIEKEGGGEKERERKKERILSFIGPYYDRVPGEKKKLGGKGKMVMGGGGREKGRGGGKELQPVPTDLDPSSNAGGGKKKVEKKMGKWRRKGGERGGGGEEKKVFIPVARPSQSIVA